MIKTCVLIRHAATAGNVDRRYIGCGTDEDILADVNAHMRSISEHIRNILQDPFIVSGPLQRCRRTSSLLYPSQSIRIIEELSEIDFGSFEGRNYEDLNDLDEYRAWISGDLPAPPKGESRGDFIKRSIGGFYKSLSLAGEHKELLICCCGGNIMAIMSHLTRKDYYDFQVGNLEGYILRFKHNDERISDLSYDRFGGSHNT